MVVDVLLLHWVSVVAEAEEEAGTEGFGWYTQWVAVYFYANNGLLASMRVEKRQRAFNVLMNLFDQVGLHTNLGKVVIMTCQPCCTIGGHYTEEYGLRTMI